MTLPKLTDTADVTNQGYSNAAGVCGAQSVSVTDLSDNAVIWVTPGVDSSGAP